ncbi:MAG: response regulator [Salinivirgaceae bacterium]|nr:response regulator [Salinivirgaceae bacterium]
MLTLKHTIRLCTLLLLVLSSHCGITAEPEFFSVNNLYQISIRETNSVCKDADGFVWVSSKMGILRFASHNYRFYNLPYSEHNALTVRLECRDNMLVAYCNTGQVFIYNRVSDQFEPPINLIQYINRRNLIIYKIAIDTKQNLWVATSDGFFRYADGQIITIEGEGAFYNLEWLTGNNLIVAGRTKLQIIDTSDPNAQPSDIGANLPASIKTSLFCDTAHNRLWIGTKTDGLLQFDFKNHSVTTVNGIPKLPVLTLKQFNDSTLLAGIDGHGISAIDISTSHIRKTYQNNRNNPQSLASNGVYDILCEPGKRVWVCTYDDGVLFSNIEAKNITQFQHLTNNDNSIKDNHVNDVCEDADGNLWFATNNGVSRYNPQTDKWLHTPTDARGESHVFLSVCTDSDGRIWAGTYSSGLYVFDRNGRTIAHYSSGSHSNYNNDFVFSLKEDRNRDIWIGGTNNDIFRYNRRSRNFSRFDYEPVNTFAELDSLNMLLGCTNGLFKLNKTTGHRNTLIDSCIVNDILVQGDTIWVATHGNGLLRISINGKITARYDTRDGLPSDFVTSLLYAADHLWIGTETGLCKFAPSSGKAFIFPSTSQLSTSFNRHAALVLSNGNLIWGTSSGAVCLNPDFEPDEQSDGKIFIQDISVAGSSIRNLANITGNLPVNQLNQLKLNYTQNTIKIELEALGRVVGPRFAWKMEGLDANWNLPAVQNIISYPNLPSSDFDLIIRLYDNTLSHIIDERTLHIVITPPLWRRSWFIIICYLIVCLIVYMIISQYIHNIKRQHAEDKIRFFTNTAHEIRTSLTLIKAPIEELHKEKKLTTGGQRNLELASVQAQQLSAVVTQLMDFQKADIGKEKLQLAMADIVGFVSNRVQMFESMAAKSNIELQFTHNTNSYNSAIDTNMMAKVIDNLISNAIKYSPKGGVVSISLECSEKMWRLSVTDHGIGISRQAQKHLFTEFYRSDNSVNSSIIGSGIGLMLVKNYVEMHNGKVTCSSQEGKGSVFTIEIPVAVVDRKQTAPSITVQQTSSQTTENKTVDTHESDTSLLIVEDNENLLQFMRDTLADEFNIATATNGNAAWKAIVQQQPDIVISDIMMPEMDGFELCQQLKSTFETAHIPIILLTALSGRAEQLQGLGLGADDYLTKPFDMDILRLRLKTLVRNRQLTKSKIINSLSHGTPVELGNKQNDEFVQKLHLTVKENMGNCDFDKEQFAAAMNVSSSLLYKKIKALTDLSPTDFIKTARLEYALQLLKAQKYNITEISEMCGFASAAYFSTVFKKQYGVAPSDYDGTEDFSS